LTLNIAVAFIRTGLKRQASEIALKSKIKVSFRNLRQASF
jgi:hypothetical protein